MILLTTYAQQDTTVLNLLNQVQQILAHQVLTMITLALGVKLNVDLLHQVSTKICQHKQQLSRLKFVKLATIARSVHILLLQEQPPNRLVFYSLILVVCVKLDIIVHQEPQFRSHVLLATNVLQLD